MIIFSFLLSACSEKEPEVIATKEITHTATITTNLGNIELDLYGIDAPVTVNNFITYANDGYYQDLIFHRVIKDFMIQGGGYSADLELQQTNEPIVNEANNGLSNIRGTIVMARTNAPHSATSQFFINHQDNKQLDYKSKSNYGYAVFGLLSNGFDVLDQIAAVSTDFENGFNDVPIEDVLITSVIVTAVK